MQHFGRATIIINKLFVKMVEEEEDEDEL